MTIAVGNQVTFERTFSNAEVLSFGRITGDEGSQHTRPNPAGNLMVHGLLLAALPTKIGGELSFLARDLTFEFLRPVYTGDPIRCTVTVTRLEATEHGTRLSAAFECMDSQGRVVMRGTGNGSVRRPDPVP